jgi:polyisoprenyl-phosphate glycosyltransferase
MAPELSIVIPAFNEAECVGELHTRLTRVLSETGISYEILFVDDGSTDDTLPVLRRLVQDDPRVRVLRLSRNFGHQAALTAGLTESRGGAVITMDADLQHPPELIPALLEKWRAEYEVVSAIRGQTQSVGWLKRCTSSLFYWLINRLSPLPIARGAADFRLMDRRAVDALNAMPERTRFLRGLIPWIGFRQTEVPFEAPGRFAGEAQYTLRKMGHFALDGILSLSATPLRIATVMGLIVMAVGFLYGVFVIWSAYFNERSQPGWASIILVILLLGGMQIFCIGIIGEYLARVFDEVKGRPLYIVAESLGRKVESVDEAGPAKSSNG